MFNSTKHFIGVDLGTHSIKIAIIKPNGDKLNLVKCAELVYPPDFSYDAPLLDRRNAAITLLRDYVEASSPPSRMVATSVSGNAVIVRFVKLEKMTRDELSNSIAFQAEPYIPFNVEEVNLSFSILGDTMEDGHPQMDTILVAAKKETVDIRVDILREAGLQPQVIDVDAFALENIYETLQPNASTESVVLLNIGANLTNLVILEKGTSRVVRDIAIAGNAFTKSIVQQVQHETTMAEEKKQQNGLSTDASDPETQQISDALASIARDLISEVQRSIDFYISQGHERSIQRIVLMGGSANLKQLDQFLSTELSLPVEIFNPFQYFAQLPKDFTNNPTYGPQLALALGLALRKERDVKS